MANPAQAHDWLEKGDYHSSILASREALRTSELAFFDPSMLALLYLLLGLHFIYNTFDE